MLIPPSVLMIVYGVVTEQGIGKLFIAGIVPGLVVTAVLSIGIRTMIHFKPALGGVLDQGQPFTLRNAARAAGGCWAVVLLILMVLGGIWGGLVTPTEAGAVGAAGGFLLIVVKRKLHWRDFWQLLLDGGQTTASIFLLLICAQMYSRMLTISGWRLGSARGRPRSPCPRG